LVSYIAVTPWIFRNGSLPDGRYALSYGTFGRNLWVGTWERNPDWAHGSHSPYVAPAYAFRSDGERNEILRAFDVTDDTVFQKVAIDRLKTSPIEVIKTWIARYPYLWIGTRSELTPLTAAQGGLAWRAIKMSLFATNAIVLFLGLAGILLAFRARSPLSVLIVPIVYIGVIYVPFHNIEPRYSAAALPFLYYFLVYGLRHISGSLQLVRNRRAMRSNAWSPTIGSSNALHPIATP
jgi:hypothetical protein